MTKPHAYVQTFKLTGKHRGESMSIAWVTINGLLLHNMEIAENVVDSAYMATKSLNKDLPYRLDPISLPSIFMSKAAALQYTYEFRRIKCAV